MRISDWSSDVCSSDHPGDAAAGVGTRPAHVEPLHRPAIAAVAEHRARGPELVEAHIAVHDVAADEPELAFEPFGRQARLGSDARAEAGGVFFDGVDDAVGGGFLFVIPVPPVRPFGRELLADEARDIPPPGGGAA